LTMFSSHPNCSGVPILDKSGAVVDMRFLPNERIRYRHGCEIA
jgi:hypothetical protein